MLRGGRLLAAATFALAIPMAGSAGPIIFDNGVVAITGASPASGSPVTLAEDFELTAGQTTIAGVQWTGFFRENGITATDEFKIQLFADAGGLPTGSALMAQTVTPVRTAAGTLLGYDVFTYEASIVPITLAANTTYWLALDWLDNGVLSPDLWVWSMDLSATSHNAIGSGAFWQSLDANRAVGEFDFRLTAPEVPEPATLALFGLALAGAAARRRSAERARASVRKALGLLE